MSSEASPESPDFADVTVGARCPSYQASGNLAWGYFLRRGGIPSSAKENTPFPDCLPKGDYLVGINCDSRPVFAQLHNRQSKTPTTESLLQAPTFRTLLLYKVTADQTTTTWVPFHTLFSSRCLADLKVGCYNLKKKPSEPEASEAKTERAVAIQLYGSGLEPQNDQTTHPLNGLLAFKTLDHNKPRRYNFVD